MVQFGRDTVSPAMEVYKFVILKSTYSELIQFGPQRSTHHKTSDEDKTLKAWPLNMRRSHARQRPT